MRCWRVKVSIIITLSTSGTFRHRKTWSSNETKFVPFFYELLFQFMKKMTILFHNFMQHTISCAEKEVTTFFTQKHSIRTHSTHVRSGTLAFRIYEVSFLTSLQYIETSDAQKIRSLVVVFKWLVQLAISVWFESSNFGGLISPSHNSMFLLYGAAAVTRTLIISVTFSTHLSSKLSPLTSAKLHVSCWEIFLLLTFPYFIAVSFYFIISVVVHGSISLQMPPHLSLATSSKRVTFSISWRLQLLC